MPLLLVSVYRDGKSYWTKKHLKWLKELPLEEINKETLDSYLLSYETVSDRLEQMNRRIEEIAEKARLGNTVGALWGLAEEHQSGRGATYMMSRWNPDYSEICKLNYPGY